MVATLKPGVRAKYANELSQAQKMAEVGYDKSKQGKARINESVYGSTDPGSFNVEAEMKLLQNENITDNSFLEAYEEQQEQMRQATPDMINNAIDAVQQENESFPSAPAPVQPQFQQSPVQPPQPQMPQFYAEPPQQQQVQEQPSEQAQDKQEEKEEAKDVMPSDPDGAMRYVAQKLFAAYKNNAPTYEHLKQWKQMHGNIFILEIADQIFLYRYIKRVEWNQLMASEGFMKLTEDQQDEHIATRCTLWPKFTAINAGGKEAGLANLLAQQIKMHSLFLDPAVVASYTIKL